MILQLSGLGTLIDGVRGLTSDSVNAGGKKGNFDFWYQWRNSEVSATAWRIL